MDTPALRPAPSATTGKAPAAPARPPLDSGALFAGGGEVVIRHGAELYRLRLTRQNKLILTK
jgi:hemin uptake protein HemP